MKNISIDIKDFAVPHCAGFQKEYNTINQEKQNTTSYKYEPPVRFDEDYIKVSETGLNKLNITIRKKTYNYNKYKNKEYISFKDIISILKDIGVNVMFEKCLHLYYLKNLKLKGIKINDRNYLSFYDFCNVLSMVSNAKKKKKDVRISAINTIKEIKNHFGSENIDIPFFPVSCKKEYYIVKKLKEIIGGKCEIKTDSGYIDLMNETHIIEIKELKNWKAAIGQIICYGLYYPDKQKKIILFHKPYQHQNVLKDTIINVCGKINIEIDFYEVF